jgi:hypothetical protein
MKGLPYKYSVILSGAQRSRKPALSEVEVDLLLLFGGNLAMQSRRINKQDCL